MSQKKGAWVLIGLAVLLCGSVVGGMVWYRSRTITTAKLLKRLPTENALVVYIDFAALRRGGILQLLSGSKATEDADYQAFVRKINFDAWQDLDSALLAIAPAGKYMFASGRFDWQSLRSYAIGEGGNCYYSICRMAGSTPERRISFFPLQSKLMALAVSNDQTAVLELQNVRPGPDPEVPDAPIWLSIPASVLKSSEGLPAGTRMFAHSMEQAESVKLMFAPEANRLAARLEVRCRNEQDAVDVAARLASATLTLKQMLEREHQMPGPADLAGVLASGAFRSQGRQVFGYWPIERVLVESLLSGGGG